jgi:carbonic anhydrase
MRNLILFSFILIAVGFSACSEGKTPTPTKFITNDSTLLFTFVKDSLYVDTYESGCGIEEYRLEVEIETSSETLYKAYEFVLGDNGTHRPEIHFIRLSKNPMGAHWEYYIKFDDEEIIPINKIH